MSRDFNGTTQYASRSDGCGITDYPCTVALWVRPDALATIDCLFAFANTDNTNRQQIFVNASGSVTVSNEADEEATASNTIGTGAWYHVCGIFTSATSRRCVVDGNWASSGTNTVSVSWPGSVVLTIIGTNYWGDDDCDGQFAHIAVWSSALSQTNVEDLAAGANPLAISAGTLQAYWPFAGTSSPEPDDANSYDMTLTGSPPAGSSDPTVDDPPGGASVYAFQ